MDKFDATEILRIYIPGLYAVWLFNYLSNSPISDGQVGVLAIFAGLMLNTIPTARPLMNWYVEKGDSSLKIFAFYKHDWFNTRRKTFISKFEQQHRLTLGLGYLKYCEHLDSRNKKVNLLSRALTIFDSTRHQNPEIKQMRLASTFSYLYFQLCLISVICLFYPLLTCQTWVFDLILPSESPTFLHAEFVSVFCLFYSLLNCQTWISDFILLLASLAFLHAALINKKSSLEFEANTYKRYNVFEITELQKILDEEVKDKINLVNKLNNSFWTPYEKCIMSL